MSIPKSEIIKAYKELKTLKKVSEKLGITIERVRQIVNPSVSFYCVKHKIKYNSECAYCAVITLYPISLKKLTTQQLQLQIQKLIKPNRQKVFVLERMFMVMFLLKYYKFSISEIGRILHRHHSSIANLKEKYEAKDY